MARQAQYANTISRQLQRAEPGPLDSTPVPISHGRFRPQLSQRSAPSLIMPARTNAAESYALCRRTSSISVVHTRAIAYLQRWKVDPHTAPRMPRFLENMARPSAIRSDIHARRSHAEPEAATEFGMPRV